MDPQVEIWSFNQAVSDLHLDIFGPCYDLLIKADQLTYKNFF